jgi:hypothetical protein
MLRLFSSWAFGVLATPILSSKLPIVTTGQSFQDWQFRAIFTIMMLGGGARVEC